MEYDDIEERAGQMINMLESKINNLENIRNTLRIENEKLTEQLNEMIQKFMEKSKNDINNAENGGEHADE